MCETDYTSNLQKYPSRSNCYQNCQNCQNNKLAENSEELRPTQKQALTILCLHLLENKIWHRSVWYSKCNPNQEGSSQTKQSLESIIQQRFLTPTDSLHKELEVLKVKDINKLHTAKFAHMQQNNKTPNIFKNFFIANQTVHQHNTRQNHNLHINQPNTNNGKRTMKYHGATIWNALAGSLRKIESNKTFGSQLKRSLLANY